MNPNVACPRPPFCGCRAALALTLTPAAPAFVQAIAFSSNMLSWLSFKPSPSKSAWSYDFTLFTLAVSVVYCCAVGIPAMMWVLQRQLVTKGESKEVAKVPSFTALVSVYGYSASPFVPAALLCVIPNGLVQVRVA